MAKRSHNEAFLKLGFTESDGKPKCIGIYLKVLFAESMKKNKLKRHFETNDLNQGCATHGPRATIRPSRPVNVALDDGRTKKIFFF